MEIRSGSGRCRVEWTRIDVVSCGLGLMMSQCPVVWVWAYVESSGPDPMSNQSGLGQFWVVWLGPMSSRSGSVQCRESPGRCRVVRARADRVVCLGPLLSRAGSSRCRADRARANVNSFGPMLMLSRSGPNDSTLDRSRVVWARIDVEFFRAQIDVESSGPESMLIRLGPGWCRDVHARSVVESTGPEPMLSRASSGWCRVGPILCQAERALAYVELSGLGPMSSRLGLADIESSGPIELFASGWYRAERAWVDVVPSRPGSMSSRASVARCGAVRASTDVESFGLGPMSICLGPDRCRVEFVHIQVEST